MERHRQSQRKSNWYDEDCKTRQKLESLDPLLLSEADKKIDAGLNIAWPITVVFRWKKIGPEERKAKIRKIIEEAKAPEPPKPPPRTKTEVHHYPTHTMTYYQTYDGETAEEIRTRKPTEEYAADGPAFEVKDTYEGPEAKRMWEKWEREDREKRIGYEVRAKAGYE